MTGASGGTAPSDAARIDGLYELAIRRHQAGEFREAEELYRAILEADPRQLDCLNFLGMIALQSGRPQDSVDLIGKAIAANDNIAAYHASIAEAYRVLGQRDTAIGHYRKALAIEPGDWAAHNNLANALRERGELEAAGRHYALAVAIKPDLASALHNLAGALLTQGRANDALDAATRALAAQDTDGTRSLFVQCVRNATSFPGSPAFRGFMIRAISEVWGRPVELAGAAVALVKYSHTISAGIKLAMDVWPRRLFAPEVGQCLGPLVADELLRAVMESAPVCDAGLERLLTGVRAMLLEAAANATSDVSEGTIAFSCALARQCFINEYVFEISGSEQQALTKLRNLVTTALALGRPVLAIHLIALAAYVPLHSLEHAQALLDRTWPDSVSTLINEQIREPQEEAQLRATIPRLTQITDTVSVDVRQQYEESPYPRWIKTAAVPPADGIAAYLRAEFPLAPLRDRPEPGTLDILIAGCGTGQQSIAAAQRFPNARLLAIDLSLTSLAYAMRKSAAAGVMIEYNQADIVRFAPAGRSFDVIEASGVLHHLADPVQGWSALLRLLKPGGFMRLGFYSELARADIAAARRMISERGYGSTPNAVRRCRQDMISAQETRFAGILASPDFYSTSACRDLLFHALEHRLTLPQIGAFLAGNQLSLLGFELDAPILAKYRNRFPDDAGMTDLENWHRFETENPATFRGMYQFWVQKELQG